MQLLSKLLYLLKANTVPILILFLLSGVYFFLRLIVIKDLPIFTDEALYVRWAQMGFYNPAHRLTSLSDGKQPLYIWLVTIVMNVIASPLAAGRIVSVFTGYMTILGLYLLSLSLFKNKWVGILTVCFYVLLPFALVYDRMALYESTSSMFFVWSLYIGILFTKTLKLHYTFILALVIGGGMLTKSTGFLSIYLAPLLLLLLPFTKKHKVSSIITWFGLLGLTAGLSLLYYSILQLSPEFYQIGE